MNKLLLTGNLTADARVNTVKEGQVAVSFTVATNDGYSDAQGNWVEDVQFHDCTRFVSGDGQKLVAALMKGRGIEVEGSLRSSKPREGNDGKVYHNKFVRVENIKFGALPKVKDAPAE